MTSSWQLGRPERNSAFIAPAESLKCRPWYDCEIQLGECQKPAQASIGKAVLYCHGGAYMLGSPASHRHLTNRAVAAARPTL